MKKLISITVVLVVVVVIVYLIAMSAILTELDKNEKKIDDLIGREVILSGDTLEIINGNSFLDELELENGKTVDYNFAVKKLVKK